MINEVESVVIRFAGDSGDGMQLTGTQFSSTSMMMGNDLSTFPDYPAEIRAPKGTVAGVSGFQIQIGSSAIDTAGDDPDVLIAMNPAALKANIDSLKRGGLIIVNTDSFDKIGLKKAGYEENPLDSTEMKAFQLIKAPISSQTLEALKEVDLDKKAKGRCKNFYALGMAYFVFGRSIDNTAKWIEKKFKSKPNIKDANILALTAGRNYAETLEAVISTYKIPPAKIDRGHYCQMNGNTAVAWGLLQAAESAGLKLFLGSYPITPASEILHDLSAAKFLGAKTFQAEDEIAGICSAIGASFGGALAVTTTSGPGLALKSEAIGLAVIAELPLVIVNVQRGGPSTGLPTKTEQSDLLQALYGRNGECPAIVLAASRPRDCFYMAYEAARLSLEHMTPVILLTDGYIANGIEPWRIPDVEKEFLPIRPNIITDKGDEPYLPYKRDDQRLARTWAIPGTPGLEHRIGGLEKDGETGNVSYDPKNHQEMCEIRQKKVDQVANFIPEQKLEGEESGDLLVLSWGGTYGAVHAAVLKAQKEGKKVSLAHVRYINPMPSNLGEIFKNFKKVLIPELNLGQMRSVIRERYQIEPAGYNKVEGLPFKVGELLEAINKELENV